MRDVGGEKHAPSPFQINPHFSPQGGHLNQVIRPPNQPSRQPCHTKTEHRSHAFFVPNGRHRTQGLVAESLRGLALDARHQIERQGLGLAHRKLRRGRARFAVKAIDHMRAVAQGPQVGLLLLWNSSFYPLID